MAKRHNQTDFDDNGKIAIFAGDFDMARQIDQAGRDIQLIFTDLSNGLMPAEDIRNVLAAGLVSLDGKDLVDVENKDYIEYLISEHGLQECSIVARLILSHALIGDKKKLQTVKVNEIREVIMNLIPSHSKNMLLLGSFLVVTSLISAGLVCLIFKYFGKHILLQMV